MNKLGRRAWRAVAGLASIALLVLAWAWWSGNRSAELPSLAERQQAFQRAVGWAKAHEAELLEERGAALWWLMQAAAERSGDAYLTQLVRRSVELSYPVDDEAFPSKRMIYPGTAVMKGAIRYDDMEDYQRFFIHAVTCQPLPLDDGGSTAQFTRGNACQPMWRKVFRGDTVCTTHQLMGIRLLRRAACAINPELGAVESSLLEDLRTQLQWDVGVKDAYIQRVLMLTWSGRSDLIKPVWQRRVLAAQQADGGWMGRWQFPDLPPAIQPWPVRQQLARWLPSVVSPDVVFTDFHASAQGLLLAALLLPPAAPAQLDVAQ
jgi:hypothetical protein